MAIKYMVCTHRTITLSSKHILGPYVVIWFCTVTAGTPTSSESQYFCHALLFLLCLPTTTLLFTSTPFQPVGNGVVMFCIKCLIRKNKMACLDGLDNICRLGADIVWLLESVWQSVMG